MNKDVQEWLAEFDYEKDGKMYHYKSRIRASNPDSAIDRVYFELLDIEKLDKDYVDNDLVIKIRRI